MPPQVKKRKGGKSGEEGGSEAEDDDEDEDMEDASGSEVGWQHWDWFWDWAGYMSNMRRCLGSQLLCTSLYHLARLHQLLVCNLVLKHVHRRRS